MRKNNKLEKMGKVKITAEVKITATALLIILCCRISNTTVYVTKMCDQKRHY